MTLDRHYARSLYKSYIFWNSPRIPEKIGVDHERLLQYLSVRSFKGHFMSLGSISHRFRDTAIYSLKVFI